MCSVSGKEGPIATEADGNPELLLDIKGNGTAGTTYFTGGF